MNPSTVDEPSGSWDSIHVFETAERGRQARYKLTSTVMLQLVTQRTEKAEDIGGHGWKSAGEVNLSGSMTRQVNHRFLNHLSASFLTVGVFVASKTEQDWPLQDSSSHITNTGKMIEEMEIKMRNLLQEVRRSVLRSKNSCIMMAFTGIFWENA
jgi:capping protein beta